jgi:hypothetical protein
MKSVFERRKAVGSLIITGFCLLGFAFLAPDAGGHYDGSFFKLAAAAVWHRPWEWAAAWCSLKIICFSIGWFLIFESCGALLARKKYRDLALTVFCLEIFSVIGCLAGGYFLLKALF